MRGQLAATDRRPAGLESRLESDRMIDAGFHSHAIASLERGPSASLERLNLGKCVLQPAVRLRQAEARHGRRSGRKLGDEEGIRPNLRGLVFPGPEVYKYGKLPSRAAVSRCRLPLHFDAAKDVRNRARAACLLPQLGYANSGSAIVMGPIGGKLVRGTRQEYRKRKEQQPRIARLEQDARQPQAHPLLNLASDSRLFVHRWQVERQPVVPFLRARKRSPPTLNAGFYKRSRMNRTSVLTDGNPVVVTRSA